MTEPFQLSEGEALPRSADSWIDRVRAADAEAEAMYKRAYGRVILDAPEPQEPATAALIAIAAELRAARIARRPGAGLAPPRDSGKPGH